MARFAFPLFLLSLIGAPALAAAPALDPQLNQRLETAMSTYVISQLDRSVQTRKTIPRVEKRKPAMDPGEAVEMREDVFVERRLLPSSGAVNEENAVRIFRRDPR